ncbi:cytochrome P450 [Myxococcus eversor]|uniref:cytochrome P450 n=1 Tax=Myxococcus eversor TaxID=2709661 RepID=UPI0013D642AF|nr:cytochrome P450 [Myxococcus eversor]
MTTGKDLLTLPPGPKGKPLFGSMLEAQADPLGFFGRTFQQYGDAVRIRVGPRQTVFLLSHPDYVKHVLVDNAQNYPKPHNPPGKLLGKGLFPSEGEFWRQQRRFIQPAFHPERMAALVPTMVDSVRKMLDRWEARTRTGEVFDIANDMTRLSLSIVGRGVFTDDMVEEQPEILEACQEIVRMQNMRRKWWMVYLITALKLRTQRRKRFRAGIATLDAAVYAAIASRRQNPTAHPDMLGQMMAARDPKTGDGMSDEQLRDECVNLFFAGHETTAVALAWTWLLLSQHPEVEQRMRDEIVSTLGDRPPQLQDLPKLRYITAVFEEVLRLYPPAWVMARQAKEQDKLGAYDVPAGTVMMMMQPIVHKHPAFWEEPEKFMPERFMPESAGKRPRFAYFPFGAGQRLCIGSNMALMQSTVALTMMLQRFKVNVVPGQTVIPDPVVTLRSRHGLQVSVSPAPAASGPLRASSAR